MATQLNVDNKLSELTIGEIAQDLGCSPLEAAMRLYRAFGFSDGPRQAPKKKAPERQPQAVSGASRPFSSIDIRKKKGRDEYDELVYGYVVGNGPDVSAVDVRKAIGGSPLNVRASLNRLIDAGKISYEGRARSTRYTAT